MWLIVCKNLYSIKIPRPPQKRVEFLKGKYYLISKNLQKLKKKNFRGEENVFNLEKIT